MATNCKPIVSSMEDVYIAIGSPSAFTPLAYLKTGGTPANEFGMAQLNLSVNVVPSHEVGPDNGSYTGLIFKAVPMAD